MGGCRHEYGSRRCGLVHDDPRAHARRRRLNLLLGNGSPEDVLTALDAYRNPDGGYGWALEPDLRSATSQPVAAMHALEVLAEVRDTNSQRALKLCNWLADHTLPDGGMPFALPYADTAGSAPFWANADATVSSLQMTAQLAAQAHRLARHRSDIAGHPWLAAATPYCLDAIDRTVEAPHAHELMFAMRFLDAAAERVPRARPLLDRLARYVVSDGPTPVTGGVPDEVLHLLDFTPHSDAFAHLVRRGRHRGGPGSVGPPAAARRWMDRHLHLVQPGRGPGVAWLRDGPGRRRTPERRPMTGMPPSSRVDQVSGKGGCHHAGVGSSAIRSTHFTHQKPRRPGATSRSGKP